MAERGAAGDLAPRLPPHGGRARAAPRWSLALPVRRSRRGEYHVGKVSVELADPFDLAPIGRDFRPDADLLVMPDPRVRVPVDVLRRLPFGVPTRAARIFEERERFAGVRPYEPGDPLNRIHWRLTGHAGQAPDEAVRTDAQRRRAAGARPGRRRAVLGLDLSGHRRGRDRVGGVPRPPGLLAGWRVGLVANTHLRRGRGPLRVPSSSAVGHEAALFAALARMPNEPTSDLAPVLREAARPLGRGRRSWSSPPRPGPGLRHEMALLRRRGIDVVELSPLEVRPRWGWVTDGRFEGGDE